MIIVKIKTLEHIDIITLHKCPIGSPKQVTKIVQKNFQIILLKNDNQFEKLHYFKLVILIRNVKALIIWLYLRNLFFFLIWTAMSTTYARMRDHFLRINTISLINSFNLIHEYSSNKIWKLMKGKNAYLYKKVINMNYITDWIR